MRLFIDTGSVAEVEEIAAWGVLSGATTNPSLLAKEEGDAGDAIRRICELVDGPTSAEVTADDTRSMVEQGRALRTLHEHIVVKVPFGVAGLAATKELRADGHPVNMTLVFSASQALLSAEAGATYISCFMGRLDDVSIDSTEVVAEIVEAIRGDGTSSYGDCAQILAASLRSPEHLKTAARLGCEVATVPGKVLRQAIEHPLTTSGTARFSSDWKDRPELVRWMEGLVSSAQVAGR
jgi:transaldolase